MEEIEFILDSTKESIKRSEPSKEKGSFLYGNSFIPMLEEAMPDRIKGTSVKDFP